VTAQQILDYYETNEVATDNWLKGHIIEVAGVVKSDNGWIGRIDEDRAIHVGHSICGDDDPRRAPSFETMYRTAPRTENSPGGNPPLHAWLPRCRALEALDRPARLPGYGTILGAPPEGMPTLPPLTTGTPVPSPLRRHLLERNIREWSPILIFQHENPPQENRLNQTLLPREESKIATLRRGQSVVFRCPKMVRWVGSPTGEECILMSTGY
jgi:hypothetical protein